MRTFPILFAATALPCLVGAQTTTNTWEQQILNAYVAMQNDSPFQLQMSGTETVNKTVRNFSAVLYWNTGVDPRSGLRSKAYVELDDYDNSTKTPVLLHRYVGDGKNLWAYDLTRNTFSANFYSYIGATPYANYPGTDAPRLLGELVNVTKGSSSYLVRLMQEINPGGTSTYSTWAPGYPPGEPPTDPPTQDPLVPSRIYATGSTEEFVLYSYPIVPNPTRSVAFQIDNLGTPVQPNWRLTEIYFADKTPTRFLQWTITITDPYDVFGGSSNGGIYVPYTAAQLSGWRQITTTVPFNG